MIKETSNELLNIFQSFPEGIMFAKTQKISEEMNMLHKPEISEYLKWLKKQYELKVILTNSPMDNFLNRFDINTKCLRLYSFKQDNKSEENSQEDHVYTINELLLLNQG